MSKEKIIGVRVGEDILIILDAAILNLNRQRVITMRNAIINYKNYMISCEESVKQINNNCANERT